MNNSYPISDIYKMDSITISPPQTKQCPFCAETIQAAAVKCRFCGEFLNTNKAKALQSGPAPDSQPAGDNKSPGSILFEGKPSLWAITATAARASIVLVFAVFLMLFPFEHLSIFQPSEALVNPEVTSANDAKTPALKPETAEESSNLELNRQRLLLYRRYRILAGFALIMLVMGIISAKIAQLKMTRYEVSSDRIEWSRGLLDRKVDNLDMFRIIDLKLRRNLLDCIVGVGSVTAITTDKTDPEFTFEKIRNPRGLYDAIKKASLDADRRGNVIHVE